MTRYDLSPLFRSTVGFDNLSNMIDNAFKAETPSYPPYNIAKLSEDDYEVTMAVSGFTQDDIDIVVQQNTLTVSASVSKESKEDKKEYLHRGIATRSFERKFSLADNI